jgi:EAL domain-containing protein (putative c-di-GMP-specific phosphodiesterase class I)
MSAGVAMGGNKLLTRADIALHQAKEQKIPISFYKESENVEKQYHSNIAMASTIRKALATGRILCHYQPIVNIFTGKIDKYETLVRMIDEEGTLIMPLQFLPIAKKTKLYPRITKEVIHQACHLFSNRSEEFSVNISMYDIHDSSTLQEIITTITQTGTASRIVFEILESDGIENYQEVAQFISKVKALGAKIAIDDFGTGYSNFEHILKLDVDYIKIDGSLIREITDNPRHRIIVETIVDFSKKIGAKTIAEFVSDEAIYTTIKEIGVDYSQGYYTGKPEPLP